MMQFDGKSVYKGIALGRSGAEKSCTQVRRRKTEDAEAEIKKVEAEDRRPGAASEIKYDKSTLREVGNPCAIFEVTSR